MSFSFGRSFNWLNAPTKFSKIEIFGCSEEGWKVFELDDKPVPCIFSEMKILTLNVFFDKFQQTNRYTHQFKIFEEELPHFICLQEVTSNYLRLLSNSKGMMKYYFVSDNPVNPKTFHDYGAVMLIRRDLRNNISKVEKLQLPSTFGRDFIFSDILMKTNEGKIEKLNIGSIHLESLGNCEIRRAQLFQISDLLQKSYDNAIIMGDFNFDSERNFNVNTLPLENDFLKSEASKDLRNYKDVWKEIKYKEKDWGKTYDNVKNKMICELVKMKTNRFIKIRKQQMRYDRIMIKSQTLKPSNCYLVLDEEIKGTSDTCFPSDHFGIVAVLTMS